MAKKRLPKVPKGPVKAADVVKPRSALAALVTHIPPKVVEDGRKKAERKLRRDKKKWLSSDG